MTLTRLLPRLLLVSTKIVHFFVSSCKIGIVEIFGMFTWTQQADFLLSFWVCFMMRSKSGNNENILRILSLITKKIMVIIRRPQKTLLLKNLSKLMCWKFSSNFLKLFLIESFLWYSNLLTCESNCIVASYYRRSHIGTGSSNILPGISFSSR